MSLWFREVLLFAQILTSDHFWLVVWNIFIFPYIGNNDPNWLIFFGGVETTNQIWLFFVVWRDYLDNPPTLSLSVDLWVFTTQKMALFEIFTRFTQSLACISMCDSSLPSNIKHPLRNHGLVGNLVSMKQLIMNCSKICRMHWGVKRSLERRHPRSRAPSIPLNSKELYTIPEASYGWRRRLCKAVLLGRAQKYSSATSTTTALAQRTANDRRRWYGIDEISGDGSYYGTLPCGNHALSFLTIRICCVKYGAASPSAEVNTHFYWIIPPQVYRIFIMLAEGSLEVKLPTISTDEKQRWEESERIEE